MPKIRNIAAGPRGVYAKLGDTEAITVNPGQVVEAEDYPEGDFEIVDDDEPLSGGGGATGGGVAGSAVSDEDIRAAIDSLDPYNDDHWTKQDLPQLDALAELLDVKVSRAQVEAAAPGKVRPAIGS
jgi:hypothetical protein